MSNTQIDGTHHRSIIGGSGLVDGTSTECRSLSKGSVIAAVISFLTSTGWTVAADSGAEGPEIGAERDGERLHVHAEAALDTVESAVDALGAALVSWRPDTPFALAYPRQQGYLEAVARSAAALQQLGVTIFWVDEKWSVEWTEADTAPLAVVDAPSGYEETAPSRRPDTCRLQIIAAARKIAAAGWSDFSPDDITRALHADGSPYTDATIRTHIVSSMSRRPELERTGRGRYRLLPKWLKP